MKSHNARHQDKWRARMLLKARYFDAFDHDRVWKCQRLLNGGPESRALWFFFAAYPRCAQFPSELRLDEKNNRWEVVFRTNDLHGINIATAFLAMAEISSLPVHVTSDRGPVDLAIYNMKAFETEAKADIEELRTLGLWDRNA